MGICRGALLRALSGAVVAGVTLVLGSMAVIATPQSPAGASGSPHGVTSPPTVTASNWQPFPSLTPTSHNNFATVGVSCATSTFCVAVGYNNPTTVTYPLVQEWNGTTWTDVSPSVPGTQLNFEFRGISCVSASFCMGVGYSRVNISSPDVPLFLLWNGSTWSIQNLPLGTGQTAGIFSGVSCLSTTFCLAVGDFEPTASSEVAASEVWNGSQWQVLPTATVAGVLTYLESVSCTSQSSCQAVGATENGVVGSAVVESWNGSSLSMAPIASPPSSSAQLNSVSCAGPAFCTAVGNTYTTTDSNTDRTLAMLWNGSSWSVSPSPNFGGTNGDQLDGVSCFAATSCSAVGFYQLDPSGNNNQNEAMIWNGATWSNVAPANYPTASPEAGLSAVDCLSNWACIAVGTALGPHGALMWNIMSPIARSGYRFVASDGGVFNYGAGAPFLGSLGGTPLNAPIVGMGTMPAGDGYYLVAADGGVFAYGSAQFHGSMGGKPLNKPIVGIAVTPDGGGYWLVASDGGVFAFGDANFYGSTGAITLNKPVVGIAAAPNGLGYWIVATDGGVFNYGSATFFGSTGGMLLNKPIVGIGATTSGQYYLVASDGGIFAFPGGAAGPPFFGSTGAINLNKPIIGMTVVQNGYYLSGSDGGIFSFPSGASGPPFFGSTGGMHLNAPIVGVGS